MTFYEHFTEHRVALNADFLARGMSVWDYWHSKRVIFEASDLIQALLVDTGSFLYSAVNETPRLSLIELLTIDNYNATVGGWQAQNERQLSAKKKAIKKTPDIRGKTHLPRFTAAEADIIFSHVK